MIVTGKQIKAARALAGLDQRHLATAASLHVNAVRYWERRRSFPGRSEPFAVRRIRKALETLGITSFVNPTPGVRLSSDGREQTDADAETGTKQPSPPDQHLTQDSTQL